MLLKVLLHKYVQLKYFWNQFKNVHLLTRSVQLEAMYLEDLLYESIHVVQGLFVWFPLRFICVSKKQSLSQQPRHLVIFLADKTVSESAFKTSHLSLISSFTQHNVFLVNMHYVCTLGVSPSLVSRYSEGYSFWSI